MQKVKETIVLLRIPFSVYLLPVFLFALSQAPEPYLNQSIWVFFILHLIIYPSSNGYNSFIDKDTESIGGLEKPPLPSRLLFYVTLMMDVVGVLLSLFLVNYAFGMMVIGYILASRAYSSRFIRLKKYPIIGFLVVFIFQGAYTFIMVLVGVSTIGLSQISDSPLLLAAIITSLMIGGGYPLTQIYQHKADKESGDRTLSMMLNYKGTFLFSVGLFGLATLGMFYYFFMQDNIAYFIVFQLCSAPLIIWFLIWMRKVWKNIDAANFKYTMKMNNISAVCLNLFYVLLVILNHSNLL